MIVETYPRKPNLRGMQCLYLWISLLHSDLLEKSRVIQQQPGERCYHIFYQLLAGADDKLLGDLLLTRQVKSYNFLANGEVSVDNLNDSEELKVTTVCESCYNNF